MIDPGCQRYLEEPEANTSHLAECAECRAIASGLGAEAAAAEVVVDPEMLPLAPWEGAANRSWALVIGAALSVLAIAIACGMVAGVSPLHVVDAGLLSVDGVREFILTSASSLRRASLGRQIGFGILVIAVDLLLFLLLRRTPRGIDA